MSTKIDKVVTRYAPSPTGFQHIGGIRTALFAYLWARKNQGTFILRIEDTDKSREVQGAIAHTIEALNWLGISYDFGPDKPSPDFGSCLQSDRLDIYKTHALKLIEQGLAYPDPYTAQETTAFREQAQAENRPFLFRDHRPKTFAKWDGHTSLRFKVPEIKRYTWQDEVQGELTAGPEMLDDFVILKADGYPTYNFAHIIDDLQMGVTHVMRGQEFISSTPKFLSLYDALEIPYPKLVTLPPIMSPDGKKKLSKRDGAKDLLEYRAEGYLPETMCNFLALIGWNPGGEQELFSEAALQEAFSIAKIQRSGGAFNEDKLRWMNKQYLQAKSLDFKVDYLAQALPERIQAMPQFDLARLERLTPTVFERIHNQAEIKDVAQAGEYDWVFSTPKVAPALVKWKHDDSVAAALPRLEKVLALLSKTDFSSPASIKEMLWPYAEEVGKGEVLWPMRTSLTGLEHSPDPFMCAYILGKEESQRRLQAVLTANA